MRGKYRQFILRVTAENKDEIDSANVPVSAERTLDLTVEMVISLMLIVSKEPNFCIASSSWRAHSSTKAKTQMEQTYDDHFQDERLDVNPHRAVPQSRKRRASPSFDDYDNHSDHHPTRSGKLIRRDREWSRSPRRRSPPLYGDVPFYTSRSNQEFASGKTSPSIVRRPRRRSDSPEYRSHASPSPPPLARTPLPIVHVGPGYPHRAEDEDSSDSSDEPFTDAVECLLREDLESNDYFKAIASNKACDIVKQYEIVSGMFKKWVGKRPPWVFSTHRRGDFFVQTM
jgi:hypothetical protein